MINRRKRRRYRVIDSPPRICRAGFGDEELFKEPFCGGGSAVRFVVRLGLSSCLGVRVSEHYLYLWGVSIVVRIRPITEYECQLITDWNNGKDEDYLYQWAGNRTYTYPIDTQQIIARLNSPTSIIYLISADDVAVGSIELNDIDRSNARARVCRFILCDGAKSKGIGTLALKQLCEIAFHEMNLKKITLGVFCYNVGAIRCYEKCGFLVKEYYPHEDARWSSYVMELFNCNPAV